MTSDDLKREMLIEFSVSMLILFLLVSIPCWIIYGMDKITYIEYIQNGWSYCWGVSIDWVKHFLSRLI